MTPRFKPSHLHASDTDNGGALLQLIYHDMGCNETGVKQNAKVFVIRTAAKIIQNEMPVISLAYGNTENVPWDPTKFIGVKGGGHTRKMLHTPHQFSLQIVSKMVQTTILFSITQITYL